MALQLVPADIWPSQITQASIPANANSLRLEAVARGAISFITALPASPADGDLHVLSAAIGAEPAGTIALRRSGVWHYYTPALRMMKTIAGVIHVFNPDGSNTWRAISVSASDITTGTLADARLSANVALLNATQTFSGASTFTLGCVDAGGNVRDVPHTLQNANYTFALADRGRTVFKNDINPYTYTLPANASVALPIGFAVWARVVSGTGALTIARAAGVSLRLVDSGTDANATIPIWGRALLVKEGTDSWVAIGISGAAGSGTVTSVGLSLPDIFAVTGSPVTASGTLAGALVSQAANLVFSSPNGVAGVPTFRALLAADVPALDAGKITSGTFPVARGGTGLAAYTAGNYVRAFDAATLEQRTPAQVLADVGAAAATHAHSAADITSGTLAAVRGGTGIASYTAGNYVRAFDATTLEQRTPAQVRADAGADNASNLVSGTVADARLSTNVALLNATQTFSGTNTFTLGCIDAIGNARDIPHNLQNIAYTFVMADRGRCVHKTDANAYTYTLPTNATVAFPIGAAITVRVGSGTGAITIARSTGVVLRLAGSGTDANATVAVWGQALLVKEGTDAWVISGVGVS